MLNLKRLFIIFMTVMFSFQACSQSNTSSTNHQELKEGTKIMNAQRFEKIKSLVNNDFGWVLDLDYQHTNCSYEILVNDVPIITFFGLGNRSTSEYINKYIMQSGKQDITIRIYPAKINDATFKEHLNDSSQVKITVFKKLRTENPAKFDVMVDGKDVWELHTNETPKVEEGANYAEFKTSFDLKPEDLNWAIDGWSESEDLRHIPNIKDQVIAFYKMYMQVIEKRDEKAYFKLMESSNYEYILSEPWHIWPMYLSIQKNEKEAIAIKQKFIFPLESDKVELKFYGDGRVVTLVSTDPRSYGYSPLVAKEENQNFPMAHTFYLHIPKGSKDLEIIR